MLYNVYAEDEVKIFKISHTAFYDENQVTAANCSADNGID